MANKYKRINVYADQEVVEMSVFLRECGYNISALVKIALKEKVKEIKETESRKKEGK